MNKWKHSIEDLRKLKEEIIEDIDLNEQSIMALKLDLEKKKEQLVHIESTINMMVNYIDLEGMGKSTPPQKGYTVDIGKEIPMVGTKSDGSVTRSIIQNSIKDADKFITRAGIIDYSQYRMSKTKLNGISQYILQAREKEMIIAIQFNNSNKRTYYGVKEFLNEDGTIKEKHYPDYEKDYDDDFEILK